MDFLLDIEAAPNAPEGYFTFLPDKIMIRVEIAPDFQNCYLTTEVSSSLPIIPPYVSRENFTRSKLILPYSMLAPAIAADGSLNMDVAAGILASFYMVPKPPPEPEPQPEPPVEDGGN